MMSVSPPMWALPPRSPRVPSDMARRLRRVHPRRAKIRRGNERAYYRRQRPRYRRCAIGIFVGEDRAYLSLPPLLLPVEEGAEAVEAALPGGAAAGDPLLGLAQRLGL